MESVTTPVALFIFNRPEETKRVFEVIRRVQPRELLIVADGPRSDREVALTEAARAVTEHIDWSCKVLRNYSERNLGCKQRVSSGISWVFEHVPEAIILEDDCLPEPSFFQYCETLLEKYRNDERVMHISGDNFQQQNKQFSLKASYYFSRIPHIWGWATWRRAWEKYDINMTDWPKVGEPGLKQIFNDPAVAHRWAQLFDQHYRHELDTWDGQWTFACLKHNGLSIMPRVNLISNIGWGSTATHAKARGSELANLPTEPMPFPLIHPTEVTVYESADAYIQRSVFAVNKTFQQRVLWVLKQHTPRLHRLLKKIFY